MKYLPLVWAGLWRKRTRTIFTLLSIIVAFLLFGMLQGVNSAFDNAVAGVNLNRLYVASKYSMIEPLPISMKDQIATVPGVLAVTYTTWFGGYYQDPKNGIYSAPVDAESYFKVYSDLVLPPEQFEALKNTRTGAVIGPKLVEKYGWKIGDRISLMSFRPRTDGSNAWPFDIVGIYKGKGDQQGIGFYFNFDYYNETVTPLMRDKVGNFVVTIDDTTHAGQIGKAIDALFANSANETHTQTEKENAQSFMKQLGDINFIVSAIVGAVFFTLLFLTGNTMMQSVRERIPEFAVLKTLGFGDYGVVALVITESAALCLVAAVLGLSIAALLFPALKSFIGIGKLPLNVFLLGLVFAVILAGIAALPPALKAKRLSIAEALTLR
jgi:putative ABC transport system permease protein